MQACACARLLAWTPSTGMALRNSSRETSPSPSSSHIRNISTTCAPCLRSAREICSSTGTCTNTPPSYSSCGLMPSHGRARLRTPFLRPSLSILRSSYRTCARLSRGAATLACSSSLDGREHVAILFRLRVRGPERHAHRVDDLRELRQRGLRLGEDRPVLLVLLEVRELAAREPLVPERDVVVITILEMT